MLVHGDQKIAVRLLVDRNHELADRPMWRVQEGELSEHEAYRFAFAYLLLASDDREHSAAQEFMSDTVRQLSSGNRRTY